MDAADRSYSVRQENQRNTKLRSHTDKDARNTRRVSDSTFLSLSFLVPLPQSVFIVLLRVRSPLIVSSCLSSSIIFVASMKIAIACRPMPQQEADRANLIIPTSATNRMISTNRHRGTNNNQREERCQHTVRYQHTHIRVNNRIIFSLICDRRSQPDRKRVRLHQGCTQ